MAQEELQKQYREQQQKYVYYIVSISVTAIGFSIYKTTGSALSYTQIPLAIAVACWGFSVYCGLKHLQATIHALYANNALFEVAAGREPKIGNNIERQKVAMSGINEAIKNTSDIASDNYIWQERLFYFGIILFVIWHVLEMYKTTITFYSSGCPH